MFEPVTKGKTKIIWPCLEKHIVEIQNKDDITAGDGVKHDVVPGKGAFATQTTVRCFELLQQNNVKTHFVSCDLPDQNDVFIARRCLMVPLEVVIRRFAEGSYLKRYPDVKKGEKFETPLVELFLKDDAQHDPFIVYNGCDMWYSYPASDKFCADSPTEDRSRILFGSEFFPSKKLDKEVLTRMEKTALSVFFVLEKAWKKQKYTLIDLKVEFGFDCETGELLVADVIDNDSWRLRRDEDGEEMSKQAYRDGESLQKVCDKYFEVAVASLGLI